MVGVSQLHKRQHFDDSESEKWVNRLVGVVP